MGSRAPPNHLNGLYVKRSIPLAERIANRLQLRMKMADYELPSEFDAIVLGTGNIQETFSKSVKDIISSFGRYFSAVSQFA